MKDTMDIYIFDKQQLLQIPESGPVKDLLTTPQRDRQEKGKEVLTMDKDLPADHLTATDWG